MAFDLNTSPRYKYGAVPNDDVSSLAVKSEIFRVQSGEEILRKGIHGLQYFEATHPYYVQAKQLTEPTPQFRPVDKVAFQNGAKLDSPKMETGDGGAIEGHHLPALDVAPYSQGHPLGGEIPLADSAAYLRWFTEAVQELYLLEYQLKPEELQRDAAGLDPALKELEEAVNSRLATSSNTWEGGAQQAHRSNLDETREWGGHLLEELKTGKHTIKECAAAVCALIQEKALWVANLLEYKPQYKVDEETGLLGDVIRLNNYLDHLKTGTLYDDAAAQSSMDGSKKFPWSQSGVERVIARVSGELHIQMNPSVAGLNSPGPRPADQLRDYLRRVFIQPYEADIDQFNSLCRETRKSINEVFTICFGGAPPNPQQVGWS